MLAYLKLVNPSPLFYRAVLKKFISFFVSLKVHILTVATYFLWIGKITPSDWKQIILGIAAANVAVKGVSIVKDQFKPIVEKP